MSKYVAKPLHFIYPVVFFAAGIKLFTYQTEASMWIGFACLLAALSSYLIIMLAGIMPHYINYWNEVNRFAELMLENNNPELWHALGFTPHIKKQETKVQIKDLSAGEAYPKFSNHTFPVSDEVMNVIADGTINNKTPFSEVEWVNKRNVISSNKFRALQKEFELRKYIRQVHNTNRKLGFTFTRLGVAVLETYLDMKITKLSSTNPLSASVLPKTAP